MKKLNCFRVTSLILSIVFIAIGCGEPRTKKDLTAETLIPIPEQVSATGSSFLLTGSTTLSISDDTEEMNRLAYYFNDLINPATGFDMGLVADGDIQLIKDESASSGNEGYTLSITENNIIITSQSGAGIFYGIQTLRQLLPDRIESTSLQEGPWEIATGEIKDSPQFTHRGSMLDVSRHFFGVDDVKRYIDFLAFYKMNRFHLHLTDDQGWRIEIKSWPRLTEFGGSTEVGGGEGGFFTQDQYKDIVSYAADRYITIIPEIDMPGHTNAALASYPELNCDGKAPDLYTGIEVGFSTLCTDKEVTYQFLDDVFREISEITPGPYIHIGGDESHSTKKEDYIPFIDRVEELVNKYGKQMIGWDETAQSDLSENSVVQLWANPDFAREAKSKGVKLIMSPADRSYLDMKYDSTTELGLSWAAYIEVDDGYNWDPTSKIEGISAEDILGIEAPLWSETITNMDDIEYLVFPRLPGYAEIGWSRRELNWVDYSERLARHASRMEAQGINYYKSPKVPW